MSHAADLPLWAALLVALLLVLGSGLTLLGAIGLVRLDSFYKRVHSPTLGTTWGTGGILLGSMLFFSMIEGRPVLHELLIAVFVTVTTPVTLMLLARAALYRDRMEKNPEVPTFVAVAERSSEVVVKGTKNGEPEKS
ncbi:monovalent cation/H(+) antiporter subunit G [Aquamicrobium defluvii]|uniref:Monovalent cation/H+ antiporter subunit G n=1 Tax=Aquamicrobium defluvii TaxID=69279 RepID=A0A011TFX1_9HYPH|nr:monovalent cation/H(+) antiporter subunit G [Aquamicrobium defluvii]EXL10514.1 monovalent cation/H+ antiporter subunit G [Aquamicrobium defluvii]EZQ17691.1 monovalent cation/H+ antiporter subunit G [Halopseudomonas bauzanensis]TDR37316.1 multisubunit potassium/proton antiporter PhaG subunit [Aquamicrobium defluvii]